LNKKISEKDKKDWQDFLNKNEKLEDKDKKISKKNANKTRLLDLHGYSLDKANQKIKEFIKQSYELGVEKLIIVTGKGIHSQNEKDPYISKDLGILKYSVPEFISNNSGLMNIINEITDANIEDGGSGAFYIFLKKNKSIK